jgi:hypothetical protein
MGKEMVVEKLTLRAAGLGEVRTEERDELGIDPQQ